MYRFINELVRHHNAVKSQFLVNIGATISSTKLGWLWWILDPILLMAIYTFVIRIVFDRGGPDYHVFALCGIVTWQSFSRSITSGSSSLLSNVSLIRQSFLPLEIYVFIPTLVQAFFYLAGLFVLFIFKIDNFGFHTFFAFFLLFPVILLSFGISLFYSILEVFFPDTRKVLPYILNFGFYLSPILYSSDKIYSLKSIPEYFKIAYSLNPIIYIIEAVRDIFLNGKIFDFKVYIIVLVMSALLVQIGLQFFRHFSSTVVKSI
ncbi:MAG: ABC transporter permease [Bacteroidales bacterium]